MSFNSVSLAPNKKLNIVRVSVGLAGQLVWTPPPNTVFSFLRYYNSSSSGNLSLSMDDSIGVGVAMHGPGTITLTPTQLDQWQAPGVVPLNNIYAIADQAGVEFTLWWA